MQQKPEPAVSLPVEPAKRIHPAAAWAGEQSFSRSDVDCTTSVVLKILDGKCKMTPGEAAAVFEIYDVVYRPGSGALFDADAHRCIAEARTAPDSQLMSSIHQLRLFAEQRIPKPVMKAYKAMLRHGLFG